MGCGCDDDAAPALSPEAQEAADAGIVRYFKGAAGMLKSLCNYGTCPLDVVVSRRFVCRACEHAIADAENPGRFGRCGLCDCVLSHKTRVAKEACPAGRWGAWVPEEVKEEKDGQQHLHRD